MRTNQLQRSVLYAALTLMVIVATPAAMAVGTPAGTVITNTATVDYEDVNGNALQETAQVTTTVSAVYGVSITPATQSQTADPSDYVCYAHNVVNEGNDTDTIEVSGSSSNGWTPVDFYADVNSNGVYDSGTDTALTNTNGSGGVDTGALPDSVSSPGNNDLDILACLTVPAGTANGTTDDLTVDIESAADSNETDQAIDTTTVSAPALTVTKAVSPVGNQPPGTTLTYTITISNAAGAGQANNVVLTDPAPTNTTYVANSITQDAVAKGDGTGDGDNADWNVTTAGAVTVDVGNMAAGTSTVITFQVTID